MLLQGRALEEYKAEPHNLQIRAHLFISVLYKKTKLYSFCSRSEEFHGHEHFFQIKRFNQLGDLPIQLCRTGLINLILIYLQFFVIFFVYQWRITSSGSVTLCTDFIYMSTRFRRGCDATFYSQFLNFLQRLFRVSSRMKE